MLFLLDCSTNGSVLVTSLRVHSVGVHSSRNKVLMLTIYLTQGNIFMQVDWVPDTIQPHGVVCDDTTIPVRE